VYTSIVDIQCATAKIRRGKKEDRNIEETTGQKYNGLPYYIWWPQKDHIKILINLFTTLWTGTT